MPTSPLPQLINTRALASRVSLTRRTILRWAREGLIPHYKINDRVIRFNEFEVAPIIAKLRRGAKV